MTKSTFAESVGGLIAETDHLSSPLAASIDESHAAIAAAKRAIADAAGRLGAIPTQSCGVPFTLGLSTWGTMATLWPAATAVLAREAVVPPRLDLTAGDRLLSAVTHGLAMLDTFYLPTADDPVPPAIADRFRPTLTCSADWGVTARSIGLVALAMGCAFEPDDHGEPGAPIPAPTPTWAEIAPAAVQAWHAATAKRTVLPVKVARRTTAGGSATPRAPRATGDRPTVGDRAIVGEVNGRPFRAGAGSLLNSCQARAVKALGLSGDDAKALRGQIAMLAGDPTVGSISGAGYDLAKA